MNENTIKTNENLIPTNNETSTNTKEETTMAANASEPKASDKKGSVRYYVTTDTHGYPWGRRGTTTDGYPIDFDLGDNTTGYVSKLTGGRVLLDLPEEMNAKIALLGNHDTSILAERGQLAGHRQFKLQTYMDTANKIAVYGLDTCTSDANIYEIPTAEINELAEKMGNLASDWDVIILTHAPLFEGNARYEGVWNYDPKAPKLPANTDLLFTLLKAFKAKSSFNGTPFSGTGRIIGCFAGHMHVHIKTTLDLGGGVYVPTEVFTTNGADEWYRTEKNGVKTAASPYNNGLYTPYEPYINVNFEYGTVNGTSFVNTGDMTPIIYDNPIHTGSRCDYLPKARGAFALQSNYYPKFYNGHYLGYTKSRLRGAGLECNGASLRYWHLDNTIRLTVKNLGTNAVSTITAQNVWFDTYGRLRYASAANTADSASYQEIVNFKTITITLQSGGVSWKFIGGLLDSIIPPYKSGVLQGKNGWAFYFDSQGKPYGMAQNGGTPVDYGKGENWMNVYDVRIFDLTEIHLINGNVPQIGATGTFTATNIDMARETMSGANQINDDNKMGLLMRVLGGSNGQTVYWLYEGRLTSLTDSILGYNA
jgi:hypothetical protein